MQSRAKKALSRQAPQLQTISRPLQTASKARGSVIEPIAEQPATRPSDLQHIINQYGFVSRAEEIVLSSTAKVIQSRSEHPHAVRNRLMKMARLAPRPEAGRNTNQSPAETIDAANVIDHSRLNRRLLHQYHGYEARAGKDSLRSTEP